MLVRLLFALLLTVCVTGEDKKVDVADLWNDFVAVSKDWVELVKHHDPQVLDSHELQVYDEMKRKWNDFRKAADQLY